MTTTRLAVLGDSIAWGQGAARVRDRLGPRLAEGMAMRGIQVEVETFAVPGARSSGLSSQVSAALKWSPALVVVVIGANDLTHREPVATAVRALADAVRRLREAGAEVVVAPTPDLSAVPHVPVFLREVVRAASKWQPCATEVVMSQIPTSAPRGPSPPPRRCSAPIGSIPPARATP